MYFGVVNGAVRFLDPYDMSTSNLCTDYQKSLYCAVTPIQMSLIYDVSAGQHMKREQFSTDDRCSITGKFAEPASPYPWKMQWQQC